MKRPTLDEFIERAKTGYPVRDWVDEPKFEGLYVRYVDRRIKIVNETITTYQGTLDISNVTVEEDYRGSGVFTDLLKRLRDKYPDMPIYVENPLENRFQNHLERLGLRRTVDDCFFLAPGENINTTETR